MDEVTIFDRILTGEAPADIAYQDDDVVAFRDINPQAPVHVVVIPRKKARDFTELADTDDESVGRFIKGVARAARELDLERSGYRIVFNCGRHGQQTVNYVHAHILGGRQMSWPPG